MRKLFRDPRYGHINKRLRTLEDQNFIKDLFRAPLNCENIKIHCSTCAIYFDPPWEEPLQFEYFPVVSDHDSNFVWIPQGIQIKCPNCGNMNEFNFPNEKENHQNEFVTLYGDEAFNKLSNKQIYIYVFYSSLGSFKSETVKALERAKREIMPHKDPSEWVFHAAELRESRWRQKHKVKLTISEINKVLLQICDSIANPADRRIIFATVYCSTLSDLHIANPRPEVLQAAFFSSTEYITRAGYNVKYILESTENNNNHIDFDVERVSRSLRRSLSYLYTCRTRYVILPVTEQKGFDPDLEIADLVAYMIRRYLHQKLIGRNTELSIERLGSVYWSIFKKRGLFSKNHIGFPWEEINKYD